MGAAGVIFGISAAVEGVSQIASGEDRAEALRTQEGDERLRAAQEALQRQRKLDTIISSQNAQAAAKGLSPSSGSFAAIQSDTFNQFSQEQHMADLSSQIRQDSLESQADNAETIGFLGALGTGLKAGFKFSQFKTEQDKKNALANKFFGSGTSSGGGG